MLQRCTQDDLWRKLTDDMREAPSRNLMEALWAAGATVQAYDPEAMQECQSIYGLRDAPRTV